MVINYGKWSSYGVAMYVRENDSKTLMLELFGNGFFLAITSSSIMVNGHDQSSRRHTP